MRKIWESLETVLFRIDNFLQTRWTLTQIVVFVFSIIGVVINVYATWFLHRQRTQRLFAR